ncbi:hypothetical protein F4815DRAFT_442484 [Daldinia loculata]|nr:hypothetical protein F4815DRAFT_442484 [Daldinia loculata]
MSPFPFPKLPTELRCQIWDSFLETEERIVVVDAGNWAVYPMRRHISPLLIVNRESRQAAKAFYSYTVKVYHICDMGKGTGTRRRQPLEVPAGILHLNLNRDVFVSSSYWGEYFKTLDGRDFKLLRDYTTDTLHYDRRHIKGAYTIKYFFGFHGLDLPCFRAGDCCWLSRLDVERDKEQAELFYRASAVFGARIGKVPHDEYVLWNPAGPLSIGMVLRLNTKKIFKSHYIKGRRPQRFMELPPGEINYIR